MPVVLIYLWYRGRRDALYRRHIGARFGFHRKRQAPHVWVHAVSIGELRSAVPVIRALLGQGEHVVTTHFTPAGLREAQKTFADEIAAGKISAVYVPFDYDLAFRRFFAAFRPKYGLVMEVEFWPGMIMAARRHHVPLFLCNGQYPIKSWERDKAKSLSARDIAPGFAGVLVKSKAQADRFAELGQTNIAITGEMRIDQPIPQEQLSAAIAARPLLAGARRVITFASVVAGEDEVFMQAMNRVLDHARQAGETPPLFVYVPRAPERFGDVSAMLRAGGFAVADRSVVLDENLMVLCPDTIDVLVGDSLGEMYFYLAMGDLAVVGGGFNPKGSHNIIEPLSLMKPVIVGPEIWTIEFPAVEAIAAGVCTQIGPDGLADALMSTSEPVDPAKVGAFLAAHGGGVRKTLAALPELIAASGFTSR